MVTPYIENEPVEKIGWFDSLIVDLRNRWAKTGHTGKRQETDGLARYTISAGHAMSM